MERHQNFDSNKGISGVASQTLGLDSRHGHLNHRGGQKKTSSTEDVKFGSLVTANHECDTNDRWNGEARVSIP